MRADGPEMARIQQCAADNDITVVLGFSENFHNTLYISQAIIDSDGKLLAVRRKIKATHMERTIFGDASGDALTSVADTKVGRVGALSCWEHIQPLLKYYLYSHREQIHVAAWPPLHPYKDEKELWSMSREGKSHSHLLTQLLMSRRPRIIPNIRNRVASFCAPCDIRH